MLSSYYEKAHVVWDAIDHHKSVKLLDLPPSVRPPGTVLMSFPFGFNGNTHRFYFRSVFLPILILIVAVYIAGWERDLSNSEVRALALASVFLSTLPFFFQFEWSQALGSITSWGMVDAFVGSVAALAVACMIRSLRHRSWAWLTAAALFANLTIFIKPAGAVMMVVIGVSWVVFGAFLLFAKQEATSRRKSGILVIGGALLLSSSFAASVLICTHSSYLNAQIIYSMLAGQILLHKMPAEEILQSERTMLWYLLPFLMLFFWVAGALTIRRRDSPAATTACIYGALLVAPSLFVMSAIVWESQSSRYAFPFVLMAVVFTIPILSRTVRIMPRWLNVTLAVIAMVQIVNTGALLAYARPSLKWQEVSGVNLTSDSYREEVAAAQHLLKEVRAKGIRPTIYSFYSGPATFVFEAVGSFAAAMEPGQPDFAVQLPVNWLTPSVFRQEAIIDADYVLFTPVKDAKMRSGVLSTKDVLDFPTEWLLFHAWFTERGEADGVRIESETPDLRLLKVVDRRKLRDALHGFLQQHKWPEFFQLVNPQHWWTAPEITSDSDEYPPILGDVHFADQFLFPAIAVSRTKDLAVIRTWWKPVAPEGCADCRLFIHLMDIHGNMISAQEIPLGGREPPEDDAQIRLDVTAFPTFDSKAELIGIGITKNGQALPVDRGERDWSGKRLLVRLPASGP